MINPEIIASIAAVLTMVAYIPQAVKTIKTRDTSGISFWMYFISILGVIFWLVYGFMTGSGAIIFKNISVILLSSIILYIKTVNIVSGKDRVKESKFVVLKRVFSGFFRKR